MDKGTTEEPRKTGSERPDPDPIRKQLEDLLLAGLESGPAVKWTPDDGEAIRREVRKRLADGSSRGA